VIVGGINFSVDSVIEPVKVGSLSVTVEDEPEFSENEIESIYSY
jgi:hypothetical protein